MVIHVDDKIFGLLTMGLGHGLDHPVSSVEYSSLYTIQLAKNWQFRLVLAN